ncbi:hypothetical protein D3OALGA1CA_4786 [Olavius algarvensis associated proteobacterium Delta 3]|nr:hypothetical protein D3OALGB2SA_2061 [Olavius algarvensis associated proteobacterium Delta 3]CAB5156852.1 hypothetical protein D3OALGA1CA_4786 [Olavius algarvensis associated proteobacterium Delta 3]
MIVAFTKAATQELNARIRGFLMSRESEKALEMFNRFRILCATTVGSWGVGALNDQAFRVLGAHGRNPSGSDIRYPGRPISITRNDDHLNLSDGDLGIVVTDRVSGDSNVTACFPGSSGAIRRLQPRRLRATMRHLPWPSPS